MDIPNDELTLAIRANDAYLVRAIAQLYRPGVVQYISNQQTYVKFASLHYSNIYTAED
jgi:hypothetical protein